MEEPEYRKLILRRLRERDRFAAQFTRIISSYSSITESIKLFNFNKRQRHNSISLHSEEQEIQELKEKLAEIIAKKGENDQQLIEATKKVANLETQIATCNDLRAKLEERLKKMQVLLRDKETENARQQQCNQNLADEVLALNVQNKHLELKFVEVDQERVQLLALVKEMKENQVQLLNEFNEKDQQIRLEKLRHEISEAAKSSANANTPANLILDGNYRKASESGSLGSTLSAIEDHPSRCFFKMDCDEMGEVNDVCFNKSGSLFYTAGSDKSVRIYQLSGDRAILKTKLSGFAASVNRLHISNDANVLAAASSDCTIRVFSTADERLRASNNS